MRAPSRIPVITTVIAFLALALLVVVVRAEFTKKVSITGGSPAPQLSSSLATAGYLGGTTLDELTICVPSTNTNTMYLGSSSSVNATTGFPLAPGVCITYRSGARAIESSHIYCFESSTESIAVTLRER